MIRKSGKGYKIYHCSTSKKGPINATKKPVSKKKALAIHRAIQAQKARKAQGSLAKAYKRRK